jgi:hypothetical protein
MSLERLESSVPRFENTVSWPWRLVNCVFHGVSTFWRFATICETVALTSNPVPLVGDPKLSPTVPIVHTLLALADSEPTPSMTDWKTFRMPSLFFIGLRREFD